MRPGDTSQGGPHPGFPETTWDVVHGAAADSTHVRRASLEELCRRYWKPLYHYLRVARAKSNDDAKDLTQAFFLWLMEREPLKQYDPERGSFRAYIRSLLRHFVQHQDEADHSLKRGGGVRLLDLDGENGPGGETLIDPQTQDPDRAFDRAWMVTLVAHAVESVRQRYHAKGWTDRFRIYEEYDMGSGNRPTYAELALRLGVQEDDVRSYLFMIRTEIRSEILSELARTCAGSDDLKKEWDAFFKA
jgi:RNA polymerase sigma-70 factor (ECF subfamily)